jgi:Protein of unknown function (DUF3298)/Deacetylase PdaC
MKPKNSFTPILFGMGILVSVLHAAAFAHAIPKVNGKIIKERSRPKNFSITVRYPQITGAAAFNRRSEQLAKKHVADFKKDIGSAVRGEAVRSLGISYTVSLAADNLISIAFDAGTDTGGAHPNTYSFSLNYDLDNGRELALRDIFKPNSHYLKTISDYCIRQLMKNDFDREWVERGAGADAANYQTWLIKRKGIQINFDAYQVASYADGPQEVLVPYSILKGLISQSSPVSSLAK